MCHRDLLTGAKSAIYIAAFDEYFTKQLTVIKSVAQDVTTTHSRGVSP